MISRTVIYATLAVLVGWDLICAMTGRSTISAQVRWIDNDSGGLLRWMILALWVHWFGFFWRALPDN